ncbi:MAG: DUF4065 domain-containing protein [Deltaproteobacteria bacterium]|nr:DUF4065 domain-containing protein [Deltaproteobacteria bacterium]
MSNGRTGALELAEWIVENESHISHLKLQKLVFYCYGAACAFDFVDELRGPVPFAAWKHGPVSRDVYDHYRAWGREEILPSGTAPDFSEQATSHLQDVTAIYGRLSPWQLRSQSHLEQPWVDAYPGPAGVSAAIPDSAIRRHFKRIYVDDVTVPEFLGRGSSFALDGMPIARFSSLAELAASLPPASA